jgi:hypothetical protein
MRLSRVTQTSAPLFNNKGEGMTADCTDDIENAAAGQEKSQNKQRTTDVVASASEKNWRLMEIWGVRGS